MDSRVRGNDKVGLEEEIAGVFSRPKSRFHTNKKGPAVPQPPGLQILIGRA